MTGVSAAGGTPTALFAGAPELPLSELGFQKIRSFLYDTAGIHLAPGKKILVTSRLGRRVRHFGVDSYDAYFDLATGGAHPGELQLMLDLLTTNETYFFREPGHFDLLRRELAPRRGSGPFRVWSAASSSGEEAYSVAMVLADAMGMSAAWEVLGTDISARVLQTARDGLYPLARNEGIPPEYLKKYCLRGIGPQEGTLLIDGALRRRVTFSLLNLNRRLPPMEPLDVIFLRNVLIYFDPPTKKAIVERVLSALRPGGVLFIGHSETLKGIADSVRLIAPTTYRKP